MIDDLHRLLADSWPVTTPAASPSEHVRAFVRFAGAEHPATISRVMGPHFIVSHPGVQLPSHGQLVLSILLGASGVRLDAPVDIVRTEVEGGWSTLRLRGRPLVMRRRAVRNRQLEEALDVGRHDTDTDDVSMVA